MLRFVTLDVFDVVEFDYVVFEYIADVGLDWVHVNSMFLHLLSCLILFTIKLGFGAYVFSLLGLVYLGLTWVWLLVLLVNGGFKLFSFAVLWWFY